MTRPIKSRAFHGTTLSCILIMLTWILAGILLPDAACCDDRPLSEQANLAARAGGVPLDAGVAEGTQQSALTCFQDALTLIINPGCFFPPAAGDCRTYSSHFFVQYIRPNFDDPRRIRAISFTSNDASTVFPSAGVVLIPAEENRFPTPAELGNLQASNLQSSQDLTEVVVDLTAADLYVSSASDILVCLQFPENQQLTNVGVGPGIFVDDAFPDQECDFMTVDSGANWYRPAVSDPLDWGFRVQFEEPTVPVKLDSWSSVKSLFAQERFMPYRTP